MASTEADDAQGHLRAELRAHKRERILETATRLFYEHGYRATSMESIADELSATKPFIYYHFKNKYEILEEIALRVTRMAGAALARAANQGGDPARIISGMVRNYAELVLDEQRLIAVFWREESNFNEATREKLVREHQQFVDTLSGVLAEGQRQGAFVVDDLQLTSLAIMNLITFTYTWYRTASGPARAALADQYVALVLRMLRAEG